MCLHCLLHDTDFKASNIDIDITFLVTDQPVVVRYCTAKIR